MLSKVIELLEDVIASGGLMNIDQLNEALRMRDEFSSLGPDVCNGGYLCCLKSVKSVIGTTSGPS